MLIYRLGKTFRGNKSNPISVLVDVISTCSLRLFIREVCETRTGGLLGLYVVSMRSLRIHTSSLLDVYSYSSTATRPYGADGYP